MRTSKKCTEIKNEYDWLFELSDNKQSNNKLSNNKLSDNNFASEFVENRPFLNQSKPRKL